mmetsp:Transcript_2653/g.9625  ORF Transcript_2653/g.9625 Transcript_2653/m.9625 type:complete len:446 (+) Transcript_2653:245-1582(+)
MGKPNISEGGRGFQLRYAVVILCFVGTLLAYMERTGFALVFTVMAKEAGLATDVKGGVLSAFYWGYATSQVPGGWAASRFGGQAVLTGSYLIWSLVTISCPRTVAGEGAVLHMWLVRVAIGASQGVIFPAIHTVLAQWIPANEKSRAVSLTTSGMYLGSSLAMATFPSLIDSYGTKGELLTVGVLGLLWVAAWNGFSPDGLRARGCAQGMTPSYSQHSSDMDIEARKKDIACCGSKAGVPWGALMSSAAVWSIIFSNFTFHYVFYVLNSWLPTYFEQQLGVRLRDNRFASMLPYLMMFFGSNVGGVLGDRFIQSGMPVSSARKALNTVGFLCCALAMVGAPFSRSFIVAAVCSSIALGFAALARGGFSINHMDIAPRHAGVLMGISNTAGTLAGVVGVTVTGWLLKLGEHSPDGGWIWVFASPAVLCVLATTQFALNARGEIIFH